ncbi:MAG: GNAT family N-acetyltransferase [Deltaproteobacteria bacterium]|nr:GNAT family N-acetyltransferase [Deltaproteobacteria bacterium]
MIKKLVESDRPALVNLIKGQAVFRKEERIVAVEVLDEALKKGDESGYFFYCAFTERLSLAGYICFGPIPMTDNRYDLYWLAVDRRFTRMGYATELMSAAEKAIRSRGGKSIYIETSSLEAYHPARELYKRFGYHITARIKDFYRFGDDKIIYAKHVSG